MDSKQSYYYPSLSISEGEILVKGKTFGRWKNKKFIMDEEQRVFALKSQQGKKLKPFFLKDYKVENKEKRKDKVAFDLVSKVGGKNLNLGLENEFQGNQIFTLLYKLCQGVETQKKQIEQQKPLEQSIPIPQISNLEKIDYEIPCFFDTSEIRECISQVRKDQHNLENYKLCFSQEIKIYRNQQNQHQFKVYFELEGNWNDVIVQNLTEKNKINSWNNFISQQSSRIIKELHDDKAFLICEVRELKNLFVFKREFLYLRHHLKINNIDFIALKQVDQKSQTNNYQGSLKYGLWSIQFDGHKTKVFYFTEQSMMGLSYPDEDSYLIQLYLQQIVNINKLNTELQNHHLIQEQHLKNTHDQNFVSQTNIQQEQDEFFDCEEDAIDALNDKLFITENIQTNKDNQDNDIKEVIDLNARRQSVLPEQIDLEENIQDWVEKKMKLVLSGSYNSLSINVKHQLKPKDCDILQRQFLRELEGGHYIFKKDFIREEKNGGLKVINEEKLAAQKAVIKFLLTRIGASLMMGKSVTSISMPVTIFEPRSNTERVCNSMGFAPIFLEDAANSQDIYFRIKQCAAFQFGFIFMYLSCEKPFNPILGETFQGFYDNCPIYCEQISHHPPICAIQMYGRKYKIDARLELTAQFNSNSVVGRNIGTVKVTFENPHQEILLTLAPGSLNGTTFGDKVMNYLEKQFLIDIKNKIILELIFNPEKKYCQFFDIDYVNQLDYVCGAVCDVNDSAINRFLKDGYRKYKGLDLKQDVKSIKHKIKGTWVNEIKFDNQKLISIHTDFPIKMQLAQFPIPSDANFRMDLLWWKLRKFDESQEWKEKLEILQRNDRKLREAKSKKKR